MPNDIMDLITVLRDAGIGIAAIVTLIIYIRSAGKSDQRSDGIVQQLITLISNNTAVLEKNNDQREKNTIAVNEQTAAVSRMEGKMAQLLPEMMGKQALVTDALNGFEKTVDALVKQIQLIDARVDNVKIALQNHPTDMKNVAAEIRGLSAEVHQSSEVMIDMLKTLTTSHALNTPSSRAGFDELRKAKETLPVNQTPREDHRRPDDTAEKRKTDETNKPKE